MLFGTAPGHSSRSPPPRSFSTTFFGSESRSISIEPRSPTITDGCPDAQTFEYTTESTNPGYESRGISRRFEAAVEKRGTRYDLPMRLAEDHQRTAYRIYPEIEQRRIPERAVEGVHPLARKKAVVPRRILREFKPRRAYRSDLAECGPYPCDRRIVRRAHRLREYGSAPFGSGDRRLKRYFIRGGGFSQSTFIPVTEKILRLRNVERVRRRNVYRIERPFLIRRARLVQRGEYALRAGARSKGFAGLLSARKHRRDADPVKPAHGIGEIVGYEIRSDERENQNYFFSYIGIPSAIPALVKSVLSSHVL